MIDDIVHGGPKKRQQYPSFDIKDKYGIEITIGCDYDDWFYFELQSKTNKNIDKKAVSQFLHADKEYESVCQIDKEWIFWLYFDCTDELAINIWNFSQNGTFRIINPNTRRDTIKKYLDCLENFIYDKIKIQEYLH